MNPEEPFKKAMEKPPNAARCNSLSQRDRDTISRLIYLVSRPASALSPEELGEARENAGLSIGQAARLLGIPQQRIYAMEHNEESKKEMLTESFEDKINDAYGLACHHEWTGSCDPGTPNEPPEYHAFCRKCGCEKPGSYDEL